MPSKAQLLREKKKMKLAENKLKQMKITETVNSNKQVVCNQPTNNNPSGIKGFQSNLIQQDMETIANPIGYLEDIHMDVFFSLVSAVSIYRPQPSCYIDVPERITAIPKGTKHIQILYLRNKSDRYAVGHWICALYNGRNIVIYDSLSSKQLHRDAEIYLNRLFPFHPPIVFATVQQQTNTYDCGLFAIAFSTSILNDRDPEKEFYDVSKLRAHVLEMFRSKRITLFPTINRQVQLNQNYMKRKLRETEQEKEMRLQESKNYKFKLIKNETHVEKQQRLEKLKQNFQNYTAIETLEEKQKRLNRMKKYSQTYTENETIEAREKRLERHKQNFQNVVKQETIEAREKRLARLNQNFQNVVKQETIEAREKRLARLNQNFQNVVKQETIEAREKRLARLNQNFQNVVKQETIEAREKRLTRLNQNFQNIVKQETIEARDKRLARVKQNVHHAVEQETIEAREKRLEKHKQYLKNNITNETLEEKQNRLEKKKLNKRQYIANETNDKKEKRLKINNNTNKQKIANKKTLNSRKVKINKQACRGLEESVEPHSLGSMDAICKSCSSKNFNYERPSDGNFTHCCRKGKLIPDQLKPYPDYLKDLLTGSDSLSKNFKENIRKFNSALAFASMGAQISPPPGRGPYAFRIHGQIYHNTSSMYPAAGDTEKYAQLYIIDTTEALMKRMNIESNKQCNPDIMKNLDQMIRDINPYYEAFKMLKELEELEVAKATITNTTIPEVNLWICSDRNKDKRRYNIPTSNEVAVVFSSTDGEPPVNRDICIHPRGQDSIRINQFSENCDPMVYPLLFPHGDQGWGIHLKQANGTKKVTPLQFYMNRLAERGHFNPCLEAGKLTQQYIVDAYVKVESERLNYIRLNQTKLRVELYSGLMDHINNRAATEGGKPGTMLILPSTFQGGSRFMLKLYQNAMAIVREFGKPDLFVTITCNPKWKEITEQLKQGQTASDRPDIVARVFYGKVKAILKEINNDEIFGKVVAYVYVIEFQKRGLPHMHLLLTLDEKDKIRNKDDIDCIVSAEIPDEDKEPELYQIIKTHMIHGPCGVFNKNSPCMNDNKCTKHYPKDFLAETRENVNGYPLYRRRDNKARIDILWKNGTVKYTVDNRWIVPYNPYMSKKYNSHINVEICSSVKSIKYICDYLCKGHDCASVKLGQLDQNKVVQWNEINGYLDARYVSAPESCWRLLEYPLHDKSHTVCELAVHLRNQQAVVFAPGQVQKAVQRAANRNTTLTAWFLLNTIDVNAHQYHYMEIPKHYVFTNDNVWKARQREHKPVIGRMISVSPKDIERFHLRLLLIHVKGAKNYEDLRTVDGIIHNTFQEAARAKGLLLNDDECEKCLQEAVLDKFPKQLRELFAYLLCFHTTCDAPALWERFKDDLMEDYLRHNTRKISESKCLKKIQEILLMQGLQLKDFGLPEPEEIDTLTDTDDVIDVDAERQEGEDNAALFNNEQRQIAQQILAAIHDQDCKNRYFFVDGPGGTGKTFLYNTVISTLRGEGLTVLPVAWTGIAATLLKGGRTVHSTFKLPVPVTETSVCKIKGNSIAGRLLKLASLIIWDEITMAPSHALKAVDLVLKDLMSNTIAFGGKTVVLGGDFRQCLPIAKHTNHRTAIIEISMLRSSLWPLFQKLSLTQNMRVNKNEKEFSEFLLTVGNGLHDVIIIPETCLVTGSLADAIFGNDNILPDNIYDFINRAILSPKNDDTMTLNDIVLNKILGDVKIYYSADTAECDDNNKMSYPTELLNKETPTGMPPHKLALKVGAIVMLLRNMNPKRGLCNGTRLIVKQMHHNYLDLEVVTGQSKGNRIFLPRIDLAPTDSNLPFILKRRQFPIRLAFSMTINKSQGQTFDYVGINLEKPVFTHGQLYVAMSRVRSFDNLKIKISDKEINETGIAQTPNIVFKEILE